MADINTDRAVWLRRFCCVSLWRRGSAFAVLLPIIILCVFSAGDVFVLNRAAGHLVVQQEEVHTFFCDSEPVFVCCDICFPCSVAVLNFYNCTVARFGVHLCCRLLCCGFCVRGIFGWYLSWPAERPGICSSDGGQQEFVYDVFRSGGCRPCSSGVVRCTN